MGAHSTTAYRQRQSSQADAASLRERRAQYGHQTEDDEDGDLAEATVAVGKPNPNGVFSGMSWTRSGVIYPWPV